MYNSNMPTNEELPSTGKLIKSTILAALGAGVLLVTVVMPSEYGIDPTGVGGMLGLTDMGEIKQSLAMEAEADAIAHSPEPEPIMEMEMEIEVEPKPEYVPQEQEQNQGHHHGDGSFHHH